MQPNEYQFGGKDAQGYYFSATSIATDARAPCFDMDEKFRTCPVALAAESNDVYTWRNRAEKGLLGVPAKRLSMFLLLAIEEADRCIRQRSSFELKRPRNERTEPNNPH